MLSSRRDVPGVRVLVLVSLCLWLFPRTADAQIHWDASAQLGVMKRVLGDRPAGGNDAGFGPVGQLTGHVALLPLVRVGGYFGHDISPVGGDVSARDLTWGGMRVKLMSPWPRGNLRAWLFAGFGYAGVYQRSTVHGPLVVDGAGGSSFEVPFGLGASYKLRKPWELCAELGGRTAFGYTGSVYEASSPAFAGKDRFAIGLTVGILADL
ncbi:MAG: hypothetical protein JWP87_738 [Labilithrix sp.]|nr:hypothetical protein [Labilithrix sp.]